MRRLGLLWTLRQQCIERIIRFGRELRSCRQFGAIASYKFCWGYGFIHDRGFSDMMSSSPSFLIAFANFLPSSVRQ